MEKGARRTGKTAWEIAELYTGAFLEDLDRLNIDRPTILCKATDHIAEQIAFIADIEKNGFTYRTSDGGCMLVVRIRRWCSGGNEKTEKPSGILCSIQLANFEALVSYFRTSFFRYASALARSGALKMPRRSWATSLSMLRRGT